MVEKSGFIRASAAKEHPKEKYCEAMEGCGEIRLHTCFRSEGIPEGKILRSHGERLSSVAEKDAPMQTAAAKEHPKGEKGVDYLGKSVYNGLWIEKNLG